MVNGRTTPLRNLAKVQAKQLRRIAANQKMGLTRRGNARAELKRRGLKGLPRVAAEAQRKTARRFLKRTRRNRIIG